MTPAAAAVLAAALGLDVADRDALLSTLAAVVHRDRALARDRAKKQSKRSPAARGTKGDTVPPPVPRPMGDVPPGTGDAGVPVCPPSDGGQRGTPAPRARDQIKEKVSESAAVSEISIASDPEASTTAASATRDTVPPLVLTPPGKEPKRPAARRGPTTLTTAWRDAYTVRYKAARGNLDPVIDAGWMAAAKKHADLCEKRAATLQLPVDAVIATWLDAFFRDEYFRGIDWPPHLGLRQWNRIWHPPDADEVGMAEASPRSAFDATIDTSPEGVRRRLRLG